ncbi:MAG TPA: hypothetical protein VN829_23270 [Dongiaceae bacterium]|nr:hypothetical protein [Dongiaceae bacterium]
MNIGDTFVWSPDLGRRRHLYIAVTDPNAPGGRFVVFNLTGSKHGPKALTLKKGEHPFIKYDTDVNFGEGWIVSIQTVQAAIAARQAFPNEPMDLNLVRRIARFAKGHPAVSGDVEEMIIAQWKL